MIDELKTENLTIGEKYLVGEREFCGIWTYVGNDKLSYIFASPPRYLDNKIIELHIPKEGVNVEIDNDKEIPEILGKEYYLNICDLNKDRKRFFELAEKTGILIKNQ